MHNFTTAEVSAPDFDLSLLAFDEEDIFSFRRDYNLIYEQLLAEQRINYKPKDYYYDFVSANIVFNKIKISEQAVMSFIFVDGLMQVCLEQTLGGDNFSYFQYQVRNLMYEMRNISTLGNKIFSQSPYPFFSSYIFSLGVVNRAFAFETIKERGSDGLKIVYAHDLIFLLNLLPPSDCVIFLESEYENIRIAAYRKLGALSYIDQMLVDKSAEIRKYAAEIMDHGDPRFKSLIKEKTKGALYLAINKSPEGILPLFLGNSLLKKDSEIKYIFEKRIGK